MIGWIKKRRRLLQRPWVWIPLLLIATVLILIARPAVFLLRVAMTDRDERHPLPPGMVDDASRLDATPVAQVWDMPSGEDAERQLRDILVRAARERVHVSIAGARHSMGGQTIYPHGIQINMLPYNRMTLDESAKLLDVQTGARWAQVIPFLDAHRLSVAVMQTNNPFTVGGSLSVNCHGWQPNRPPIASTVDSFHIMLADGSVVHCSRTENAQLFSLALGGYGLFGIILDARLRVVPNERYRMNQYVVPTDQFLAAWDQHVGQSPEIGMALGRLSIVPGDFLNQALLYTFTIAPDPTGYLPPASDDNLDTLTRLLFRGSVDSDYGKGLRWEAERDLLTHVSSAFFSRNGLVNKPVDSFENRSADSTDILHEYFVPRDRLHSFVTSMRTIIPQNGGNLLNVTLRDVRTDNDTMLRYADHDMIALVLLFNEQISDEAQARMRTMTRQLIDAALAQGGRYYLPYRLDATPEQFETAYPQSREFFALKRHYDPGELFQNEMYLKYGPLTHPTTDVEPPAAAGR